MKQTVQRLSSINDNLRVFNGVELTTVRHHLSCGKVGISHVSETARFDMLWLVGFNVTSNTGQGTIAIEGIY